MSHTAFFTDVINQYLPEPHASLLNGIIFGTKLRTSKDFIMEIKKVGLTHLVVLSGMNITILCSIISALTARISKKAALLITIITILFFIDFVGIQAPIVRAAFMSVLTSVATLFGKRTVVLYTLVLSFIFCVAIWPHWLTSISFQLSYGATLGLILFAGKEQENKTSSNIALLSGYGKSEFRTSLAAQVFTVPLIFIYFKQLSLIAPVTNVLVSWIVTPIMIFGFITAFLGKIHYVLGIIPSYICYVLLSYLILVIHWMSQLPFIFYQF